MKTVAARQDSKRTGRARSNLQQLRNTAFATPRNTGIVSVHQFCDSFGLVQESFTRLTGFSPRAVAHWASGRKPSAPAQKRLIELTRLFDALSEMVDHKAIGEWLKHPNPAFDGSTPLQVIERGETDRLWRMIWELQTGNTG